MSVDLSGLAARAIRPIGEPQPAWMWEVEVFKEEPQDVNPMDSLNPFSESDPEEVLEFHVQNITIPEDTREAIESHFMGRRFYYPGKDQSGTDINITLFDDTRLKMLRYFKGWLNKSGDPAYGRSMPMNHLYRSLVCTLKDPSDFFITGRLIFRKCIPTSIGSIDLDYETDNFFTFEVTLKTQYWFMNETRYGWDEEPIDFGGGLF